MFSFYIINVFLISEVSSLKYSDLRSLHPSCSPKDTCSNSIRTYITHILDSSFRNCYCDEFCQDYGDCCLDSKFYKDDEQISNFKKFECVNVKIHGNIYMKRKCMDGWENTEILDLCENSSTHLDDIKESNQVHTPVMSKYSAVTYTNYYCALCNNDADDIMVWKTSLECPSFERILEQNSSLKDNSSIEVQFDNDKIGIYIKRNNTNDLREFHECSTVPSFPQNGESLLRKCWPAISTCLVEWSESSMEKLCHSYTAVIYTHNNIYKNLHCAICNNIDNDNLHCRPPKSITSKQLLAGSSPKAFSILFDFWDSSGSNLVGTHCNEYEIWDSLFKKCRKIICKNANHEYKHGKCILKEEIKIATFEMINSQSLEITTTAITEEMQIGNNNLPGSPEKAHNITAKVRPHKISKENMQGSAILNTTSQTNEFNDNTISNTTPQIIQLIENITPQTNQTVSDPTIPTNHLIDNTSFLTNQLIGNVTFPTNQLVDSTTPQADLLIQNPTHQTNQLIDIQELNCNQILLSSEEFRLEKDGSIFVDKLHKIYYVEEYIKNGEEVLVCAEDFISYKFSDFMTVLTITGIIFSCICLLLHLFAFVTLPYLKNLAGMNLASLSGTLLVSYSLFIISMFSSLNTKLCYTIAILLYYTFLSSFFWMNAISFDIWLTLYNSKYFIVEEGKQKLRYLLYTFYSFGLPGIALLITVLLDLLEPSGFPKDYLPYFGKFVCWFGQRKSLLVFFALPMIVLMAINMAYFIWSLHIINSTRQLTVNIRSCSLYVNQFRLYASLSVATGLTWITGIIAGCVQIEVAWYIFILFNTLQGVFIFGLFTCRKVIWQSLITCLFA